jgi:spoIIIJ-associated protein
MIRITANTLEEAYKKAAHDLDLSIIDLELEILQAPTSGFFGMFKKPAIITAEPKNGVKSTPKSDKSRSRKKSSVEKVISSDDNDITAQIREGIEELVKNSCYDMHLDSLEVYDDMVDIKIDGADAALMIGKEGYRYKALSYILHNWIKIKYDRNISLEIAEFLKNQESMIEDYLIGIKERVDESGKAQTKPLDGILVKIALEKLRDAYPDKYVALRSLKDGRKKVIINDYKKDD